MCLIVSEESVEATLAAVKLTGSKMAAISHINLLLVRGRMYQIG